MAETANLQIKVSSTGVTKATDDLTKLTSASKNVESASNKSQRAIGGIGRSAGQAGIQVQQFVGQIQGGQSAMLALSQQSADLGFVLGAPLLGAVVGITASLVGMATGSYNTKTAIELLDDATKEFDETLKRSDKGVLTFSKALEGLAGSSQVLARIKIATGIEKAKDQIDTAITGIKGNFEELPRALRPNLSKVGEAFGAVGGDVSNLKENIQLAIESGNVSGLAFPELAKARDNINAIQREFGITAEQASELAVAMSNVQENADPFSVTQLQNVLEDLATETGFSNSKLNNFSESFIPFIKGVGLGVDQVNALRLALIKFKESRSQTEETGGILSEGDTDYEKLREQFNLTNDAYQAIPSSIAKYESALSSLDKSLEYQIISLQEGAQAAMEYRIAQQLGFESIEQAPEAIQNQIDKIFELRDAQSQLKETQEDITDSSLRMFESIQQNVVQGLGDATATALIDMENLGEGVKGVLRGAIKQAISLMVQLGVQRLIQSQMNITATAAEATASVAAGAAITSAMTPAAAAATVATGGTNLAAAAAQAPLFAGAFSTMLAAASTPIARASGGDLQGGQSSYIAENGLEVFAPNKNGRVFNKQDVQDMMQGGNKSSSTVFNVTTNQSFEHWFDNGGADKIERLINRSGDL